ncbi:MAG: hypothetical protein AAGC95_08035 [Pseudomonadota bacterium]
MINLMTRRKFVAAVSAAGGLFTFASAAHAHSGASLNASTQNDEIRSPASPCPKLFPHLAGCEKVWSLVPQSAVLN